MRRNGMCPICYAKRFFGKASPFFKTYELKPVENGARKTPVMGWSSWNTFRNEIDEDLILETAAAMKEKGLADAGYGYINLDDNWHSSMRDENGDLQGDLKRFPRGVKALFDDLHGMGFKCGLYSCNGTLTCEDLPASLGRERQDAKRIAEFGADFLKYDFCHNIPMSKYAPLVTGVEIFRDGKSESYDCTKFTLSGNAKCFKDRYVGGRRHVSGLDGNAGYMEYDKIRAEEDGEYILTVEIRKKGGYKKVLAALINDEDLYLYDIPPQKRWNYTARFQKKVVLKKGDNKLRLFNPVARRSDSAFLQYYNMGKELAKAQNPERPITFSICEWGMNRPYKWGALCGNMWRTTLDIRPFFPWIKMIYGHTVKLYKYASPGHWNDPDMLEVGNGKLSRNRNISHFSLWCMMNAPLILGNDLRKIDEDVLSIVTNKDMIAINQDPLCKPCKRIKRGRTDILAKPLSGNRVAVCLFNKRRREKSVSVDLKKIFSDPYIAAESKNSYCLREIWSGEEINVSDKLDTEIQRECCKVYVFCGK